MNICIPIDENLGLKSRISLHFGTAPKFLVVDPRTMSFEIIDNPDAARRDPSRDPHRPLPFLSGHAVKSVVVGGIGLTALDRLHAAGISVFSSPKDTVEEIVRAYNTGTVNPVTLGVQQKASSSSRFRK